MMTMRMTLNTMMMREKIIVMIKVMVIHVTVIAGDGGGGGDDLWKIQVQILMRYLRSLWKE